MTFEEYADQEMLAIDLANTLAGELENALFNHEFASLVVPGGTTPGNVFDALCGADLDWSRVHVMLTDERWVPEGHPRSNGGLVRERLLTNRAAAAKFIPFYREGMTPDEAAPEVAAVVKGELPISVLLLGMGEDMHTASLFPGAQGFKQAMAADAPLVCPIYTQDQEEPRLTLSAEVLDGAMAKHLAIYGQAKRDALERAINLPEIEAPIAAVMGEGTVHWAA